MQHGALGASPRPKGLSRSFAPAQRVDASITDKAGSRGSTSLVVTGVPLAPKELRSSFVCWLRSDANPDAVLKSAASAIRHVVHQRTRSKSRCGLGCRLPEIMLDDAGYLAPTELASC